MPFKVQGHTVLHLKALRYCKYETRGFSCGSFCTICQDVMNSDNLLREQCFVDSQKKNIVIWTDFANLDMFQAIWTSYDHFGQN